LLPPELDPSNEEPLDAIPVLGHWVRGTLVGLALGLSVVFGIAIWLNPYDETGQARQMETHRQLGLPPCTFKVLTRLPCPSCGMTTSFALLVRGDVWNSLRANAVGTLLAGLCLGMIPWFLASALLGRPLFIVSIEKTLTILVIGFLVLMLLRWLIVLGLIWRNGSGNPAAATPGPQPSWRNDHATDAELALAPVAARQPAGDAGLQSADRHVLPLPGTGPGHPAGVPVPGRRPEGAGQGSGAGLLAAGDAAGVLPHR
jgi:hypothetical protein